MADADIEATVDQAVRQARDVAAFTHELLGCITCNGKGFTREVDPTDSAWFPKPPLRRGCRDCGGTGCDPAQETP